MNDSIKRISLDIHSTGSMETVNAKRGDTARTLIISLVDGGLPYIIGEDCSAKFYGKKPDRTVVYDYCTIKDNTIIYAFTGQTVAVEGRVNCEIQLIGDDGKLITSPKFTINVFGTVYNGDEIESSDEFNALTSLIADTQKAVKEAQEAIKAAQGMEASLLITDASGNPVVIDDAAEHSLISLKLYGKTTQDGTPTPENPADLVSVGDGGSITVSVNGENQTQTMTIATPNGLPGIPVTSGGNYTDADGQQWICDEIDFARGVYIRRVGKEILDGVTTVVSKNDSNSNEYLYYYRPANVKQNTYGYCTHFRHSDILPANANYLGAFNITVYFVIYFNGYGIVTGDNGTLSSPDEFNNWLNAQYNAGTPVTVLYVLETPIETPLSKEELAAYAALYTYREHTTVSNDAGAYMELEYAVDAKKYIDSLVSSTILQATVE